MRKKPNHPISAKSGLKQTRESPMMSYQRPTREEVRAPVLNVASDIKMKALFSVTSQRCTGKRGREQ